jgi:hypothetical protein
MPDPDNDEVARALERLTSSPGKAPASNPRNRPAPSPKVRAAPVAAQPAKAPQKPKARPVQKIARPAAPAETKAPAPAKPKPVPKKKTPPPIPGLALKRTLIPTLLTGGALLLALATVRYAWNSIDNPLLDVPRSMVIGMACVGVVCWLLAAANMYLVHRTILRAARVDNVRG